MKDTLKSIVIYLCGIAILTDHSIKSINVHAADFTVVLIAYAMLLASLSDVYEYFKTKDIKRAPHAS